MSESRINVVLLPFTTSPQLIIPLYLFNFLYGIILWKWELTFMIFCMALYNADVIHLRERKWKLTFIILCMALYNAMSSQRATALLNQMWDSCT